MENLKCKVCGKNLKNTENCNIVTCPYCGTRQTITTMDNNKKISLFNLATDLRLNFDFEKASNIYQQILSRYPNESEAYWGLCLCRYGIEYKDDVKTSAKTPTCYLSSNESIFENENYKNALLNSSEESKEIYKNEAAKIDEIQKKFLEISKTEEKYDVFICYRETDNFKRKTEDSEIAQALYEDLKQKGIKVFFKKISLIPFSEEEQELYIISALNSAKVMLLIGTSIENINDISIKNEWSNFLKISVKDNKQLIPCYKNIDFYNIPKEFTYLEQKNLDDIDWKNDITNDVFKILNLREFFVKENTSNELDAFYYAKKVQIQSIEKEFQIKLFEKKASLFTCKKQIKKLNEIKKELKNEFLSAIKTKPLIQKCDDLIVKIKLNIKKNYDKFFLIASSVTMGLIVGIIVFMLTFPFSKIECDGITYQKSNSGYMVVSSKIDVEKIVIPSKIRGVKVTSIGGNVFSGKEKIKEITLPDTIISVESFAFSKCSHLEKINFSNCLTHMGDYVFSECSSLKEVKIPDCVTYMGNGIFYSCNNLEEITIPFLGASLDATMDKNLEYSFKPYNLMNSGVVPHSLNKISLKKDYTICYNAFLNCNQLKKIILPNQTEIIQSCAFYGCSSLESITIPNSVTEIAWAAFDGCSNLQNIIIPESVTSIGPHVFEGCTQLATVEFASTNSWSVTPYEGEKPSITISVADLSQNAVYLSSTYNNYIWHKQQDKND